jgi:membrane fusion protein, copper/silver efflux system
MNEQLPKEEKTRPVSDPQNVETGAERESQASSAGPPEPEATAAGAIQVSASKAKIKTLLLILAFGFVFVIGYVTAKLLSPANPGLKNTATTGNAAAKTQWTCSMHPQFKLPAKGKCPICFMDLIPLEKGAGEGDEAILEMSKASIKLAEIQTSKVERRMAEAQLRFVGKVDYDETRMKTITSWMPGRLDRLYVDYTGVAVKKGDHLAYIYSPDLISAQEELLQVLRAVEELRGSSNALMRSTAGDTVKASREKLRLLGVTGEQLAQLEKSKKVNDHLTIYAPTGGIVVHKNAMEGMYVKTGSPIYRIADLSFVWVYLEAYESDLAWLRYGQTVECETEAYPGEPFKGRISFIDPVLDTRTRTVKVRVNTPNADGRLKPGMFVRATVKARMAKDGKILDNALAGKWISPMHPEIVKDKPGDCDVCGMPLVRAESLGMAEAKTETIAPLIIPASSILLTGTRAVVYIKKPNTKTPIFEGRVITLGPKVGKYYIVKSGLKEGEEIVSHGAFKIDSALQIQAKKSMMTVGPWGESHEGHDHEKEAVAITIAESQKSGLRQKLDLVLKYYLTIQETLAADKETEVPAKTEKLIDAIGELALQEDRLPWKRLFEELESSAKKIAKSKRIKDQRAAFSSLTQSLLVAIKSVGAPIKVEQVSCSMAFGGLGAYWLQQPGDITNPYFGASMLRCGEVTHSFAPVISKELIQKADLSWPHKQVTKSYLALQEALAADDKEKASQSAKALLKAFKRESKSRTVNELMDSVESIAASKEIKDQRAAFFNVNETLLPFITDNPPMDLIHAHCSMARDGKGGDWLQRPGELTNPYYGASMLRCGEVKAKLEGGSK